MADGSVELDAAGIFEVLTRNGVRYVVIGGIGAILHGASTTTLDLDIVPAADDDNLERLLRVIEELDGQLRVPGSDPVSFPFDVESLKRFTTVTLRTRMGDLDLAFRPDAPGRTWQTYESLAPGAVVMELDVPVPVAALDDIIASKEASARAKDLATLPTLRRLRDLLRSTETGSSAQGSADA